MKVVIFMYPGVTMLDAIGPYEVLRNLQNSEICFVAEKKGLVKADSSFIEMNIQYDITEINHADILLIPGSLIEYLNIAKNKKILDWINKVSITSIKTVSVCTGSIILAAAGILQNKKATCHWSCIDLLSEFSAIPTRERIIQDGKIITAAGVSAGIDMAIHLVNQLEGRQSAEAIQLAIEYDPSPLFNSGNFSTAKPEVINLSKQKMELALAQSDLSD
ncbi:DJ-1/PfpI family protein [Aureispira anguillae]|uniref:DJ-1/PfpI family protein n=1 Tax=Aureispira anguillae TaxID=2864201 RepID=A0A916DSA3_9BACT|nr:DJ-1/PfpI family protein [Aureispira anguillae]BDS10932.1 DJ-1/PfpI family protein [Aureispira anguillae]